MTEKIEPDYETVLKALGAVSEVEYDKLYNLLSDAQQKWEKTIKDKKRLQEQLKEANAIIEDMRPFIQASMSRQTFTRILNYEDKWGVK